jgi:hypothetical protein
MALEAQFNALVIKLDINRWMTYDMFGSAKEADVYVMLDQMHIYGGERFELLGLWRLHPMRQASMLFIIIPSLIILFLTYFSVANQVTSSEGIL